MKKIVSMTLILAMALAMFTACGGDETDATTTATEITAPAVTEATTPAVTETTAPSAAAPASALELLETVWGLYGEDEKFAVIGGSMAAPVDNAPGPWEMTDENISYSLLIPAEQLSNVTEAASMIHMMNANTFTCAAFRLAEGVSPEDFMEAMREAVLNNQWMCGFPEILVTSKVTDEYVVVAFGAADLVDVFHLHQNEAYPQRVIQNREHIA